VPTLTESRVSNEAEAERPTNKARETLAKGTPEGSVSRTVKLPEQIRYTIRPNGKFDISASTSGEGTLGLENNLTYEQLAAKVGKPIADLIANNRGDNRAEEFAGWKTGVLKTKDLPPEASGNAVDRTRKQ
jgi:hypothetical protein